MSLRACIAYVLSALMVCLPIQARQPDHPVTLSIKASKASVQPGEQFAVAVILDHEPSWHTHTNNPVPPTGVARDSLWPTVIDAMGPAGTTLWPVQWPKAHQIKIDIFGTGKPESYAVYEGHAVAYVPVQADPKATPGTTITIEAAVSYQTCDDHQCLLPADEKLSIDVPVVAAGATTPAADPDFAGFDPSAFAGPAANGGGAANTAKPTSGVPTAAGAIKFGVFGWNFSIDPDGPLGLVLLLLVAALGGLLMNFTPCVLPVIPIKIMGLSHAAGNPARALYLGMVMSLGVVVFWIALGGAIASISGFTAISSLFRTPVFSLLVGVFILVMATGMLGAFSVRLPQVVYMVNPSHETAGGSFAFGIMTAVLSTPCTAPFMGSAAAWAATQSPVITLTTFCAIGMGMALPYLVLSAFPKLVNWMPRTGPASELVKQVMGILMLGVAAFFLGLGLVALVPGGPQWLRLSYWWVVAALAVGAAAWMTIRTFQITRAPGRRVAFTLAGMAFAGVSAVVCYHFALPTRAIPWQPYSHELLASKLNEKKIVVLDFTADWCLICKSIEAAVLERPEVIRALNSPDVVPIKVDLTARQAEGWAKLKELHEVGIPLLVVMTHSSPEPVFKSNAYTPDQVLDAVSRARASVGGPATPLALH